MSKDNPESPPSLGLAEALMMEDEEKSELDKVLELLLDPANIGHNTELSKQEILAFSVLSTLAKRHDIVVLREFLAENLMLRVSLKRGGRKEVVKMAGRAMNYDEMGDMQQQQRRGIGRFMRRR